MFPANKSSEDFPEISVSVSVAIIQTCIEGELLLAAVLWSLLVVVLVSQSQTLLVEDSRSTYINWPYTCYCCALITITISRPGRLIVKDQPDCIATTRIATNSFRGGMNDIYS